MTSTGIGNDKGLEKRLHEGKTSIVAAFCVSPYGPLPGKHAPAMAYLRSPDGDYSLTIPLWTVEGKTRQEIKDALLRQVDEILDNAASVWCNEK